MRQVKKCVKSYFQEYGVLATLLTSNSSILYNNNTTIEISKNSPKLIWDSRKITKLQKLKIMLSETETIFKFEATGVHNSLLKRTNSS